MSYNIDSTTVLKCDAWMFASDVARMLAEHEGNLPGSCFLFEMADKSPDAEGRIPVDPRFWWSSEWSGNSYHNVLLPLVAPTIRGTVEVIFTWEGGDSHSGFRIVDGIVTEPKVKMTLEDA